MKKFNQNYGVYCCSHVFNKESAVHLVIRDPEGEWQFLCGNQESDQNCHHVGVGHLIKSDSSLEQMANLEFSSGAERIHEHADWEFFSLD